MQIPRIFNSPIRLGILVGMIFGFWNVLYSWLNPLADDTIGALSAFYGPMFLVWAIASFFAVRRTGRLLTGFTTGVAVAFATFCVYDLLVVLRVNLFLDELTGRADWRNLMLRFEISGVESLRTFVNMENLKGAPLKIGTASAIGAVMGLVGGAAGRLTQRFSAPC